MGIKYLLKFLNNYDNLINEIEYDNFKGEKIAIDVSIILYQVIIAIRSSGADLTNQQGYITSHILGLFNKTISLLKKNIVPIYVFDGVPPEFKKNVIDARRDVKKKAFLKLESATSNEERIKYFKRTVSITPEQINDCKELLKLMGIPYIDAPAEADSQCAYMVKNKIASSVITEDMDILTFGSSKIYRNLTSRNKKTLEIKLEDILNKTDLTYEQFIEFCMLLGCDYCERVKDIEPNDLYEYYYKHKNIKETLEELKEKKLANVPLNNDYEKIKEYFTNPPYNDDNINTNLLKPDIDNLENILVNKYGLIKSKIKGKLQYLESNYKKN